MGVTLSGTLDIEPTIDAVMINVAIRNNSGNIHPYFGLGIGVGRADADLTASLTVTVDGETFAASGSTNDDDTAFAGQLPFTPMYGKELFSVYRRSEADSG